MAHIQYKFTNKYLKNKGNINTSISKNFEIQSFLKLVLFLPFLYLYLYTISNLNDQILLYNDTPLKSTKLSIINNLLYVYSVHNKRHFNNVINQNILQNRIFILKWLEYYIYSNTINKKVIKFESLIKLYFKLKTNYENLKTILLIPRTILILTNKRNKNDKELKSIINSYKFIFNINPSNLNLRFNNFESKIDIFNYNYKLLNYIIDLLITSILHGYILKY